MSIRLVVTRGFDNGTYVGSMADVVRRGYGASGVIVTPPAVAAFYSGGWAPRKRKKLAPAEALQIIELDGTAAERERAAQDEALFARVHHEERLLTEAQHARAKAEMRWAVAAAKRIQIERDDEEAVALAMLLD
jgi:hypothetical protein